MKVQNQVNATGFGTERTHCATAALDFESKDVCVVGLEKKAITVIVSQV